MCRVSCGILSQRATSQTTRKTNKRHLTSRQAILLATRKRARHAKHAMPGRTRRRPQIKCDFLGNIFGPVKSLNNFAVRTSFRFISKSNIRLFLLKIFTPAEVLACLGQRNLHSLDPEWPRYRKFRCLLVIWFKRATRAFLDHKLGQRKARRFVGIWICANYLQLFPFNMDFYVWHSSS